MVAADRVSARFGTMKKQQAAFDSHGEPATGKQPVCCRLAMRHDALSNNEV
jgi:hypothetical protein